MRTRTPTELSGVVADLVLRLSASPVQRLLNNVDVFRSLLADKTDEYVDQANAAMVAAGNESIDYVTLVLGNNPKKPVKEVLSRADVAEAMKHPFLEEALPQVDYAVTSAWSAGWDVGASHGASDLDVWGMKTDAPQVNLDDPFLTSLRADVAKNMADISDRMTKVITSTPTDKVEVELTKVLNDARNRMRLSVDAARTRASTEAQIAVYGMAGEASDDEVNLMWVTSFSANTCATCAALHGTVVKYGDHFDSHLSLKGKGAMPYVDLAGPPRHPNCMCRLVPYVKALVGKDGPSPKSMQAWAKTWWKTKGSA